MSLLSPSQMAAIRSIGVLGMITPLTIFAAAEDTGLDFTDDPYGSTTTYAPVGVSALGWLVGKWQADREAGAGDLDTTTPYRLRLPVGTSIDSGDDVEISGNRYHVIDAGTDQTWPEWLTCIVVRSK